MTYRPGTTEAVLLPLSIHLTEYLPDFDRRKFELRLGDHVIWRDDVWANGPDPIEWAIGTVARRLQDLMFNGALIQHEEY